MAGLGQSLKPASGLWILARKPPGQVKVFVLISKVHVDTERACTFEIGMKVFSRILSVISLSYCLL